MTKKTKEERLLAVLLHELKPSADDLREIIAMIIEKAHEGDAGAIEMLKERNWPEKHLGHVFTTLYDYCVFCKLPRKKYDKKPTRCSAVAWN